MTRFKFILYLLVICANFLFDNATSLNVEGIQGGLPARTNQFTYQVGILIRSKTYYPYKLIGSGSIVSPNLVLTVAQHFVTNEGFLIDFVYSVMCMTKNWKLHPGYVVLIDEIYILAGGNYNYTNNVAVTRLMEELPIYDHPYLSKVGIPSTTESFYRASGETSGYGNTYVLMLIDPIGNRRRITDSNHYLEYGMVEVARQEKCSFEQRPINPEIHFCGQMAAINEEDVAGVCDNDAGSPLVINNLVVGMATVHNEDCDDSSTPGSPYMKVSYFARFVNSIINKNPLPDVLVRHNPQPVQMFAVAA